MSTATTHIDNKPSLRGTKQSHSLAPALRFKEFEGEWNKKKMSDLSERIGDGLHGTPKYVDESDIHFVNGNNLMNGKIFISDKTKKVGDNTFLKNDKNLADNTVLISLNGTIGNIARYNNEKVMLGKSVGYFNFNTASDYYYHILNSPKIQRFFISELTGSTIKNLSLKTLRETIIPYPSLPEQQKIASFLSAVDKKIQQLTKKKALLEDYKKGVMQQLFPSTGSGHRSGQLRFKDDTSTSLGAGNGNAYPDWEEKRLGDVGKTFNGLTGKTKDDFGVGVPYIQYMQIFRSSRINPNEFGFVQLNKDEKQNKVKFGDAFFTTSSETPKEIGTASVLLDEIEDLYLNSFCFGYRPNNIKLLIPQFSQFLLRSEVFRRKIIPLAQGSTRYNMSKVELMKLKVDIPCNEEQQKIAAYLSSIDTKIEAVKSQITQTQIFKKGLLQQLFV